MKSIVVYYSFSGNTRRAAEALADALRKTYEVDILELKALDESKSFFGQALRALVRIKAKVERVNIDLSEYDLICMGTPVWAFGPAPAMNAYLEKCKGLNGKQAIVFTTYGSGAGNNNCLNYMRSVLNKKGTKKCESFTMQGAKTHDKNYSVSIVNRYNKSN